MKKKKKRSGGFPLTTVLLGCGFASLLFCLICSGGTGWYLYSQGHLAEYLPDKDAKKKLEKKEYVGAWEFKGKNVVARKEYRNDLTGVWTLQKTNPSRDWKLDFTYTAEGVNPYQLQLTITKVKSDHPSISRSATRGPSLRRPKTMDWTRRSAALSPTDSRTTDSALRA